MAQKLRPPGYVGWFDMKRRCNNSSRKEYPRYGGRGISYDPKWESYKSFWEDMGETYAEGLTLDRVDNNGNYCKDNCKWSTMKEQQNNRRDTRSFTINGITKSFREWRQGSKLQDSTIRQRYYVYGWTIKKSLGIGG